MKKQAFVFLVIILISSLFCASLSAEPLDGIKEFLELDQEEDIPSSKKVVWFPEAQGQHTITWALAAPMRRDLRSTSPAEQLILSYDARELRFDAGLQYQANQVLQFTLDDASIVTYEDINQDNYIDSQDVLGIYEFMREAKPVRQSIVYDVNHDGVVDSQDVLRVYERVKTK